MQDYQILEARNFVLQKGGILPLVRLAYKTVGSLNERRDNVVVIPTWYTGTHADIETFMIGPNRAINPDRHFIIMVNLLGGGLSSSPSNTPAPFNQALFPNVTIYDNVRLQHMLVREQLGIERICLVTGFSMGACQTFEWAAQYPDMVAAICPIAGSARTASYNKVFLLSLRRTLELDPAFADGFYQRPPIRGLKAFAAIYAGWGFSEPYFRTEAYRQFSATSTEEFVQVFWEPFFLKCDANNLLCQLWTWQRGDISAQSAYGGDFEKALASIKARCIIVPIDHDRYFPPADSQNEARHIPGAECRICPSIWGHMALLNPEDARFFDQVYSDLLTG